MHETQKRDMQEAFVNDPHHGIPIKAEKASSKDQHIESNQNVSYQEFLVVHVPLFREPLASESCV